MDKKDTKILSFRPNQFAALVPFIIFIIITISLSFMKAADLNMMIASGIIGLIIGMFFCENKEEYWNVIIEGLGSDVGMTAVLIWLVVGIYGSILKSGKLVEGLVWLSCKLGVKGAAFTVAAFIFSAIFAVATGTGFGTIATMGFILYPAGLLLGSNPAVLGGAILSGAAFGDNLAPVSDTTIISATSQTYKYKEGTAEIGGVVKSRFKYVIVAGIIAAVLFWFFGGSAASTNTESAAKILTEYQNPMGLLLLIPTAVVIWMAVKGNSIFATLSTGTILAIIIGLAAGLFSVADLAVIKDGAVVGAIPDGVAGMTTVSILLMVVVSMGNLLVKSGCMETTVNWLNEKVIKTPRDADIAIFLLSTIFGILIAAINTIANICVSPFVNAIGRKNDLHPYRRADILSTAVCSFPFFVPYGGCVLLLLGTMKSVSSTYPFVQPLDPSSLFFTVFYSWAVWFVTLFACISGWGREFEGKDGERVKQPIKN
ncbi:Na+/H+ antiporter NhaC family protein [Tepidanaerobacter syntrophicus]|uniref:Na+/H+ antiporter NhaC n=1 Tax=Tepidanaerobacter syntrophicus TaxID=224999 RepID=A0A0U9HDM0_9FIRM|nr:Na+/H+ antiporter NhaC family protein [Tepidanaerobacter syntrophicus]GAQ24746.1 Na+/H+ antiporter NhaC [Tepidanaerobacter syntrophicus]GLI18983.1 sodium:proton antiporter [Tepidanaerobacter syntrophicus]